MVWRKKIYMVILNKTKFFDSFERPLNIFSFAVPFADIFLYHPWRKKIYNLLRRKLQLFTPNYDETTTNYEKARGFEHVCR